MRATRVRPPFTSLVPSPDIGKSSTRHQTVDPNEVEHVHAGTGVSRWDPSALALAAGPLPREAAPLESGGSSAALWRADLDGRAVVLKRYSRARGLSALKDVFRPAAPARAARAALALRAAGLPAVQPLAVHVDRPWPLARGGTLVMEAAPGLNATAFLESVRGALRPRRIFAAALGTLIARLHASGLVHGDLAPGNVVVAESGARLWLVDFDGLRLHQRSNERRQLQDLARLGARFSRTRATHGDRVRFLRAYLAAIGRDPEGWRELWRTVAPLAAARLRAWGWE